MSDAVKSREIDSLHIAIDLINSPVFVIEVVGERLVFRKLNKAYETDVGIGSASVEGKTAHEFLPGRVAETVEDNYWTCILLGKAYEYQELLAIREEERWWSTTLSPVFDDHGEVRYIVGVATDISDLKKSVIKLTKENSRVKRQNDDIVAFTAIAAHDLRPVICNVKSYAEIIMDGFRDLGDGKLGMLQTIHSMTDVMSAYVDRVLTHARSVNIEKAEIDTFSLGHTIKDIIAASDPDSKVDIAHPSGSVTGEAVVFQIILRNLIDNAIRHSTSRIAVEIDNTPRRPGTVVVKITNDGQGFHGGLEGFRRHMKTDPDLHRRTTGFGLRVVQQLAETRGGHVWLDTPGNGGGTTICVSLPASFDRHGVEPDAVSAAAAA